MNMVSRRRRQWPVRATPAQRPRRRGRLSNATPRWIPRPLKMSPLTLQPSVTPETFGEHGAKARALSGTDQGVEAGGATSPGGQGGASESIVEADQVATGRDHTKPAAN